MVSKSPEKRTVDYGGQARMACPHCGTTAIVRSSHALTPLIREVTFICKSVECGHGFVGHLEIVRTTSPSATPNPDIQIPLAEHVMRAARKEAERQREVAR